MSNRYMMTAADVAEEIGVSKGKAYKLIKDLNAELSSKGLDGDMSFLQVCSMQKIESVHRVYEGKENL